MEVEYMIEIVISSNSPAPARGDALQHYTRFSTAFPDRNPIRVKQTALMLVDLPKFTAFELRASAANTIGLVGGFSAIVLATTLPTLPEPPGFDSSCPSLPPLPSFPPSLSTPRQLTLQVRALSLTYSTPHVHAIDRSISRHLCRSTP